MVSTAGGSSVSIETIKTLIKETIWNARCHFIFIFSSSNTNSANLIFQTYKAKLTLDHLSVFSPYICYFLQKRYSLFHKEVLCAWKLISVDSLMFMGTNFHRLGKTYVFVDIKFHGFTEDCIQAYWKLYI